MSFSTSTGRLISVGPCRASVSTRAHAGKSKKKKYFRVCAVRVTGPGRIGAVSGRVRNEGQVKATGGKVTRRGSAIALLAVNVVLRVVRVTLLPWCCVIQPAQTPLWKFPSVAGRGVRSWLG